MQTRWPAVAPVVAITLAAQIAFGVPAAAHDAAPQLPHVPAPGHGAADRPSAPPALPADRAPAYRLGGSHTDDHRDQRLALALAAPPVADTFSFTGREPHVPRDRDERSAVLALAPKTSPPHARS